MITRTNKPKRQALWKQVRAELDGDAGDSPKPKAAVNGYGSKKFSAEDWKLKLAKLSLRRSQSREARLTKPKPIGRLKSTSRLKSRHLSLYVMLKKEFMRRFPMCAVFSNLQASDLHHVKGRLGTLLLDCRHWKAVSRRGHFRIHNEIDWARQNGFIADAGEWNKAPDDDITRRLKSAMDCCRNPDGMAQAREEIRALIHEGKIFEP